MAEGSEDEGCRARSRMSYFLQVEMSVVAVAGAGAESDSSNTSG